MKYDRKFYETNEASSLRSADVILGRLAEGVAFRTVLDVGCGIGTWGTTAKKLGVARYLGVDGDHVPRDQLLVPPPEFAPHDLRVPLALGESFDLALCMEVGEHLPAAAAGTLVRSLCKHAPVVLFSAAIPGQGGVDHVNEQWQSYWAALFAGEGYGVYDYVRPRVWDCAEVAEYYRQNALVYVDGRRTGLAAGLGENLAGRPALLDVVHPATYQIKADPLRWELPVMARHLPAILLRVARNRLLPS